MNEQQNSNSHDKLNNTKKLNISFDYRIVCVLLLLIIAAMLALWQPWTPKPSNSSRTITVTGESTVKAAPDVFVFSPSYEVTNADKAAASEELIAKQAEVVAGLKKLGIKDSKIKTNTGGYDNSFLDETTQQYHYSTNIEITIDTADKALVQKVQDYLVSTTPTGTISPYGSFSEALRKKLEADGRGAATKDARSKADQSAKNLGFEVGSVKSVSDDTDKSGGCQGGICTMESRVAPAMASDTRSSLGVQSGENELNYTVTVVYYVK